MDSSLGLGRHLGGLLRVFSCCCWVFSDAVLLSSVGMVQELRCCGRRFCWEWYVDKEVQVVPRKASKINRTALSLRFFLLPKLLSYSYDYTYCRSGSLPQ